MSTRKRILASAAIVAAAAILLTACSPPGERVAPDPGSATTCAAHGAPKELCFICDASLRDTSRLWCGEHARYEDRCWECHPELQEENRLYCNEHHLYEDECFLCHPELRPSAKAAGPASTGLMCKEHGVLEEECGICHPELLGRQPPGQGLKVRMPSVQSAGEAGVVVTSPWVDDMQQGVECYAELAYNQNKLARIHPLAGGVVLSVEVDLGGRVGKGDLLARITSSSIGEAQSAYLQALAEAGLRERAVERERTLRAQRISSDKDLQEAEAAHQAAAAAVQQARQQLQTLGFDEQQIRGLTRQDGAAGVLSIRAPFAGEIIERTAVQGAMVEMGSPLFTLADTTVLWAMVNIPETQLAHVHVGQKAELTVESLPGRTFPGTLTWLSSGVNDRTRMAQGRVEVANPGGILKAQMFARARILTTSSAGAVLVPDSALQNIAGTLVVFVKSQEDLFEARPVQLGARHDGRVHVLAGVLRTDEVVVAGGFALKSQLLISRLGAGCVH